jgi:hypothetical protein
MHDSYRNIEPLNIEWCLTLWTIALSHYFTTKQYRIKRFFSRSSCMCTRCPMHSRTPYPHLSGKWSCLLWVRTSFMALTAAQKWSFMYNSYRINVYCFLNMTISQKGADKVCVSASAPCTHAWTPEKHLILYCFVVKYCDSTIGTDCTNSCKSNYHMITTTPRRYINVVKTIITLIEILHHTLTILWYEEDKSILNKKKTRGSAHWACIVIWFHSANKHGCQD